MKIGILGAGGIARKMARTARGMEGVVPYAIASRTQEKADAFAAKEGMEKAYGSYEAMLADPEVDLVYVASPHSHHAEHMTLCLEAGKPVLCEKAFTANAAQAKAVLDLAREKHLLVAEAIWTRYLPARSIIDGLIREGMIGQPKALQANLCYPLTDVRRLTDPALAGGALLDVGVYPLNFALMAFGSDVGRVESTVDIYETGVDGQESITLHYSDGRIAQLMAGITFQSDRRGIIYGTEGAIVVDNINNPEKIILQRPGTTDRCWVDAETYPVPAQITGFEYEVAACMRALEKGAIECPEMPHSETLRVMEIMDGLRAQWGVRYPFE